MGGYLELIIFCVPFIYLAVYLIFYLLFLYLITYPFYFDYIFFLLIPDVQHFLMYQIFLLTNLIYLNFHMMIYFEF